MKKIFVPASIFFLIFSIQCFTHCKKDDDNNEQMLDMTDQAEFYAENHFGVCFSGVFDTDYDEVVITNEESYRQLQDSIRIYPRNADCDTMVLTDFDFSKYSLIGKRTTGGGCEVAYNRQIIDDKENNKIIYKINVEYSGECAMLIFNMNWAQIPKLPDNYTVEFQVN